MPIDIKIPNVGESITEVQISEWLKSEGDTVAKDENIAVIDSEKTTFELPSPEAGRLVKILHQSGDTVKVGDVIAQIETAGSTEKPTASEKPPVPEMKPGKESSPESKAPPTKAKNGGDKKAFAPDDSVLTKKNIKPDAESKHELPVSTSAAPENESQKAEPVNQPVTTWKQPSVKPETDRGEKIVPMTALRRTAARRLVEAKQQMAMLTTFNEVDMSAIQSLRKEHQEAFEKRHQTKLGFMSFFVKAAVAALKQFPQVNAEIRQNDIVYRNSFNVSVAIASERGLVVPVLRNADQMSFAGVEKSIADFARRAKDGKLLPDEFEGGTFTITNGGVFGSLFSTPIINPPQSGILGMHAIQDRPVAVQGQVVIRPMMYLALTYDHRIVDGREAVLFLRRIKEIIESPARLMIEI